MPTKKKPPRAKRNAFTILLAQALAPAGEAITVADIEGYIIEANDAVERVYRWKREEIIGQHPLTLCPETDYWKELSKEIWQCTNEQGGWDGVVINQDANKRQFPILLRTRKVVSGGVPYVISYARPFPTGTPFGLSPQQTRCFTLLGQGYTSKEIAASVKIKPSTVTVHFNRIWKRAGQKKSFSLADLKCLAVQCLEAGWDTSLKVDKEVLKDCQAQS